jgi:hypothetical protein
LRYWRKSSNSSPDSGSSSLSLRTRSRYGRGRQAADGRSHRYGLRASVVDRSIWHGYGTRARRGQRVSRVTNQVRECRDQGRQRLIPKDVVSRRLSQGPYLRSCRAVATRYGKRYYVFLGTATVANPGLPGPRMITRASPRGVD